MQELEKMLFHMLAVNESKIKERTSRHMPISFHLLHPKIAGEAKEGTVKTWAMQLRSHKEMLLSDSSMGSE